MVHGTQKLFGFPAPFPMPQLPPLFLAGGIITFGGLLLMIGLFTRPVALILSGEMAVAYFRFHAPQGFWPLLNDGEGAALYCFIFLFLASAGGGSWSFDRLVAGTCINGLLIFPLTSGNANKEF
jgi:putative oxidoreductase